MTLQRCFKRAGNGGNSGLMKHPVNTLKRGSQTVAIANVNVTNLDLAV